MVCIISPIIICILIVNESLLIYYLRLICLRNNRIILLIHLMLRGCDRARGHSIPALYLLILLNGIVFWSGEIIAQL